METNVTSQHARQRRRVGLLALGALALAVVFLALTCDTWQGRESGWRSFTVTHCEPFPGLPLPVCTPIEIKWKTWFHGAGDAHNAESTTDYSYDIHHWEQGMVIDDYYDPAPPDRSLKYQMIGLNLAMSTHVFNYSFGDLGYIPVADVCPSVYIPADWAWWCSDWDGTIDLGNPGGYGTFNAGVQAVGVIPVPPPNDGVEYPWYMHHFK